MRTIKIGRREFPCFVSAQTQSEYLKKASELSKETEKNDPLNLKLGSRLIYCALRDGCMREWSLAKRWLTPIPKEENISNLFRAQRMVKIVRSLLNDEEEEHLAIEKTDEVDQEKKSPPPKK